MADAVEIDAFLRSEGFDTPDAQAQARALLEANRFTRPGKRAISDEKLPSARQLLSAYFLRLCGHEDCTALAAASGHTGRTPLTVAPTSCEMCGGSNNLRAARRLTRCLRTQGIDRVLIVGGTPSQHAELEQMLGGQGLHLRCVDGATGTHTKKDALPRLQWAQLLVVWGATPLPHKVSNLYTDDPSTHLRRVPVAKRGIEALCGEILRSLGC
ncbi:MAG: hypothetical protein NTZ05_17550 [Chloroflexi bacterium]|nr:hypothetical protein [Chloroflexota bacterium]